MQENEAFKFEKGLNLAIQKNVPLVPGNNVNKVIKPPCSIEDRMGSIRFAT